MNPLHRLLAGATCVLALCVAARTNGAIPAASLLLAQPPATPASPAPAKQAAPASAPQSGEYAGTDVCVTCHTDQAEGLKGTAHAQAKNPRSPMATHGCESCHGPGKAHAEDEASGHMSKMKEMKPAEVNGICLTWLVVLAMSAAVAAGAQDVKKGEQVYTAQKCSTCHSIAGKGNKKNPLDGVGAKLSADDIRQWITHPKEMTAKANSTKKPPMPAKYSGLPAADLDALVAYLASLK